MPAHKTSPSSVHPVGVTPRVALGLLAIFLLVIPALASAQASKDYDTERARAFQLFDQYKLLDALAIFEDLASQKPTDAGVISHLGVCLVAKAASLEDSEARRKERVRARTVLLRAKELGDQSPLIQVILDEIPADGTVPPFSERKGVEDAMREGEAEFARGDLEKAKAAYGRALVFDPKQYEATLFTGDVYFKLKQMDQAEDWFERAVQIDPDRETAYRYWGDALMGQGRSGEARAKYIEAVIAEPYNRIPWGQLAAWAQTKQLRLSPPVIQSPHQVTIKDGKPNITIDAKSFTQNDGTLNWLVYEITCANWKQDLFAKAFPEEKAYRHSLPEEAAALRMVAESVSRDLNAGKIQSLDPSLATLIKLNDEGLLEAYILLSRADQGIARDFAGYRKAHRDQLRRYLDEYVVPHGQ
jgi:tetratricopeptide (TPR) repeat protein